MRPKFSKLTKTLLIAAVCSITQVPLFAQNQKVTVNLKNVPLGTAIHEIEKQAMVKMAYSKEFVDTDQKVSVKSSGEELDNVLKRLFGKLDVSYSYEGENVLLYKKNNSEKKEKKDKLSAEETSTRQVSVSGKVLDSNNEPLIGAVVSIEGTNKKEVTDLDGNFRIKADKGSRIKISYIGNADQTFIVKDSKPVSIVMKEDATDLNEIVVVGYGTQKKINLTGAVSTVDVAKQLEARPIVDVARGLQGSVPGLTVRSSTGEMGLDPSMKIRGVIGSVNGSSSPLILVDNVECNSIQNINPEDIQSISVLKDAASASIYGVKAAFGVILITTKKAKKGEKFNISYTNNFSWKKATKSPEIVETWQGAEMSWEAGLRINPNLSEQTNSCYLSWNKESIERMKE